MSGIDKPHVADTTRLPPGAADLIRRAQPPERRFSLFVYHRDGVEVTGLRPGCAVVVGRTQPADMVVADPSLSRQHARFVLTDDVVSVEYRP
jgi:pSer/pThr/pTyr-binding forkhead associated (FHA) protein